MSKCLQVWGTHEKKYNKTSHQRAPKKDTISHQIHVGSTHKKSVLAFSIDTFIYFFGDDDVDIL